MGITKRAGLLATRTIRNGANRTVLDRIKHSGDIYMAWSDEPWLLEGASVRISIVGFDDGTELTRTLDGKRVQIIHSNLTSSFDASLVTALKENSGVGFIGVQPSGPFEITEETARTWRNLPANVNGRLNSDVLKPFVVAIDVLRKPASDWFKDWIVDFGSTMTLDEAAKYEAPFEYAAREIRPIRMNNNRRRTRESWWIHGEARPGMRAALRELPRFLISPIVAKHRIFVWMPIDVLPGNRCLVFARSDNYFFGVLQSRAHEVWALKIASRLGGERPAYHVEGCFETFPLPWPPGQEAWRDPRLHAIAEAAHALNDLREKWLNSPDANPEELKKRTLTNLYNARPAWLAAAHAALDRAVWAAYGWDDPDPGKTTDEEILGRLLALNQERAETGGKQAREQV